MMHTKRMSLLWKAGMILAAVLLAVSCSDPCDQPDEPDSYGKVMIVYSAGYNNLSSYLAQNVNDLNKGYVPDKKDRDVILVVSRRTLRNASNYSDQTSPYLFRVYKQKNAVVRDTLWSMPPGTTLLDKDAMRSFLSKIRDLFPAESYGMVFASHSNGWLPNGYYADPSAFDGRSGVRKAAGPIVANFPDYQEEGLLLTRSLGPESYMTGGKLYSHEMSVSDMASAIPMHLDYLIFDSCLMGGVEVAYELKDVVTKLGVSQAEVLAEGLDYKTLAEHLLKGVPDPEAVCRDYYEQYNVQSGLYHSATTALIDCSRLDDLARACKPLFEKYREDIRALDKRVVQGFGGARKPWYFDLLDIFEEAGVPAGELFGVEAALSRCVPYKSHTGQYYSVYAGEFSGGGVIPITAFCGLTMYLPSAGSAYLDEFYRTLAWNKAAGLVE